MNEQLELAFRSAMENAIAECSLLGYTPTRIIQRLAEGSMASSIARRLVSSGEIQPGFREVISMGRADLTVESIMLQPRFQTLFDAGLLTAAQWRLENYNN